MRLFLSRRLSIKLWVQKLWSPRDAITLISRTQIRASWSSVSDELENFKPDLIHVVNPAVLGLGGIWLAKTNNIPLVASYHTHLPKYLEHYGMGMLEPLLWELLKAAHNQATLNLCTSTAMVQELSEKFKIPRYGKEELIQIFSNQN